MGVVPATDDDFVVYDERNLHFLRDVNVYSVDGADFNFWGSVRINGQNVLPEDVTIIDTNDTVAEINTLINNYSIGAGGKLRWAPGAYNYAVGQIVGKSNVTLEFDEHAYISIGNIGAANLIQAEGTQGASTNLTLDAVSGSYSITLPVGQGANFAVDDIIGLESLGVAIAGVPGARARELFQVLGVVGDVISLDKPLHWNFLVADTAKFFKITPIKDFHVIGFKGTFTSPGNEVRGVLINRALRCSVSDWTSVNGPGIFFGDALHCYARNPVIDGDKIYASFIGYGVSVAGSGHGVIVHGLQARACRHAFTTLPFGDGVTADTWTGPFATIISSAVGWGGVESLAIFDTHAYAVDTMFANCTGYGPGLAATPTYQDRGYRTSYSSCKSFFANRGWTLTTESKNARLSNCEVQLHPVSALACVSMAGTDGIVEGGRFESDAGYGVDSAGASNTVLGAVIDALVCLRESQVGDNGFTAKDCVLYISAAYAIFQAKGRYITNTVIGTGSGVVFQSAEATTRLEDIWHAPSVVAYAAAITPTPIIKNNIASTLTGPITVNNPAAGNKILGAKFRFAHTQDATGGRVVTYGSDFKRNTTAHVTTANKVNIDTFEFNGTSWLQTECSVGL